MGVLLTKNSTFLIGPISRLLGIIMNGIFEFLNWIGIEKAAIGISIILFTVILYTFLLPMTIKQQKTTRIMAVMNPELQAIQKKYKGKSDQASMLKMQEETKLIYQKYGTSPTGGCLSSLIQLPILFALWPVVQNIPAYVGKIRHIYDGLVSGIISTEGYQKVMETFAKSKAIKINDGITENKIVDILYKFQESDWNQLTEKFPDLSQKIVETKDKIAGYNNFLGINMAETPSSMISDAVKSGATILIIVAVMIPLLAGITQWISAKVAQSATNAANSKNEENAMVTQMNLMMKIMPVFSIIMCFSMPSGLGIYWITSAVVRTIQQIGVNKYMSKKSLDEIIQKNREKMEKKNKKKGTVDSSVLAQRAQTSTRNIDKPQRKTTSDNNVSSYKPNAKPGSLASKANMVSDFNNRNKKEDK